MQPRTIPIVAYTDNKSVIEALPSTKLVDDKRLRELQYKNHCRQMTLGKLNGVLEINSLQIVWLNREHLDMNC